MTHHRNDVRAHVRHIEFASLQRHQPLKVNDVFELGTRGLQRCKQAIQWLTWTGLGLGRANA